MFGAGLQLTRSRWDKESPAPAAPDDSLPERLRMLEDRVARFNGIPSLVESEISNRFSELQDKLPALIESGVVTLLSEAEARLRSTFEQLRADSTEQCIAMVEAKVASLIEGVESDMAAQTQAIASLRLTAERNQDSLNRLGREIQKLLTFTPDNRSAVSFVPPQTLAELGAWASCPKCQSADVRPSTQHTVLDSLFACASYEPFRCRNCGHRFHLKINRKPVAALTSPAYPESKAK